MKRVLFLLSLIAVSAMLFANAAKDSGDSGKDCMRLLMNIKNNFYTLVDFFEHGFWHHGNQRNEI
jgi:hypothetical protein